MTIAGTNIRVDVWRITESLTDNYAGGALPTGTIVYAGVHARMQGTPPEQILLQQGLETPRMFRMTMYPGTLDVRENDEIQIVEPFDHPYHHLMFAVDGVRYADFNARDRRNYMILELSRSVRAHAQQ